MVRIDKSRCHPFSTPLTRITIHVLGYFLAYRHLHLSFIFFYPSVYIINKIHITTNIIVIIKISPIRQYDEESISTSEKVLICSSTTCVRSIYQRSVICSPISGIVFLAIVRFKSYFPQTFLIIQHQLGIVFKEFFVSGTIEIMITFCTKSFPLLYHSIKIILTRCIIRTSQCTGSTIQTITGTLQIDTHQ